MALAYSNSVYKLIASNGIRNTFGSPAPGATNSSAFTVVLYSGTKPTAQYIIDNWNLYRNDGANTLWGAAGHAVTLAASQLQVVLVANATANAINTGTATWGIIWPGLNVALTAAPFTPATVSLAATNAQQRFIVVDVSDTSGNGVIQVVSTATTLGQPFQLAGLTLAVTAP